MVSIERFLSYVEPRADGCWQWTGATVRGYGYFRAGRMCRAHRVAYEFFVGGIPDELEVDHLCGNRGCVNPDHLEPVTHVENVERATARRRAADVCSHGHRFTPENTITGSRGQRVCRECKRRWNADAKHKLRVPRVQLEAMLEARAS